MRARLFVVFLVPLVGVLLVLGGAYAWSAGRAIQQEFSSQQLGDLSYFANGARQALRAENPGLIEGELRRYSELYGAEIVVVDRVGAVWASGTPDYASSSLQIDDEEFTTQVTVALTGRHSEVPQSVLPWALGDVLMAEPVFDDGGVIGAVVISASTEVSRGRIVTHWSVLLAISIAVIALLVFAVSRLANWVLRPMWRVDEAMAAIEHGEMDARISDETGPPEMRDMISIFNRMADQIERMVARQQEFVMNASHELRNPLGALTLRVESLATGLDESWDEEIEKTREEGRRMSRILDTLLVMATARKQDSPFAPVDLAELVRDRAEAWQVAAEAAHLTCSVQGPTTALCVTDRTAVESALDTVISNALKFAPAGTPIELTVAEQGEYYIISVRDHGPGLEPDELERVTDRFWRSARDQNMPGSGLGLAIANDLLTALNGRVEVAAADPQGLVVRLYLPSGGA